MLSPHREEDGLPNLFVMNDTAFRQAFYCRSAPIGPGRVRQGRMTARVKGKVLGTAMIHPENPEQASLGQPDAARIETTFQKRPIGVP